MTNKEAVKWLNKNRPCISMTCNKENADNINIATDMAIKALENERPQGEWVKYIRCIECSACKHKFFADDENENCQDYEPCIDLRFNFCPNCGADMRGGKE